MSSINDRWGRNPSDSERWSSFINRLDTLINRFGTETTKDEAEIMAYVSGKRVSDIARPVGWDGGWQLNIEFNARLDKFTIASHLELLLNFVSQFKTTAASGMISRLVNTSPVCGFRLVHEDDGWSSYPAGEKKFDEELIEKPLSFLDGKALKEFSKSLEHYTKGDYVESAEKSRRTLEEYIRSILNKPKAGLESGIKQLGSLLKEQDRPEHLRLLITQHLNMIDKHYNSSSKHNSETTNFEAEYLLYQVGTVMRILNEMNSQDKI